MLRSIAEAKLSINFTLLIDGENISGGDLFRALLVHAIQNEAGPVHLICLENPSKFYENYLFKIHGKVVVHDFFSDLCGWNGNSASDLTSLLTNSDELSGSVLLLDSINQVIERLGFVNTYKILHKLKCKIKSAISLLHFDTIHDYELEKLLALAGTSIHLKWSLDEQSCHRTAQVVYRKSNGKIMSQMETFTIDNSFKVSSHIKSRSSQIPQKTDNARIMDKFNNLTTFELGLQMRESERKAKEQLVLPYLRTAKNQVSGGEPGGGGDIVYNLEAMDLEDDPDDDLDI